jgi:hypothetical protein
LYEELTIRRVVFFEAFIMKGVVLLEEITFCGVRFE